MVLDRLNDRLTGHRVGELDDSGEQLTMQHSPIEIHENGSRSSGILLGLFLTLLQRRKFFILNFVVTALVALAISLMISKTYAATVTFLPPNSGGGGGLSSLLGGVDLGVSLLEGRNVVGPNQVDAVFQSQQLRKRIIDKLGLISRFGIRPTDQGKYFNSYKKLDKKLMLISDKDVGMGLSSLNSFTLKVEDSRPDSAYIIAKTVFECLDSALRNANAEDSRRKREFAEQQLAARYDLLKKQDVALVEFQKRTKIYDIYAQGDATIRATSGIRAKLIELDVLMESMEKSEGSQSFRFNQLWQQKKAQEQALSRLENGRNPDVLPSLGRTADLGAQFLELKRNIEISVQVIKLLSQQLEMSKLEEAKDESPLKVISEPMIPDYKIRPKRAFIVLSILFFEHALLVLLIALQYVHFNVLNHSPEWARIRAAVSRK